MNRNKVFLVTAISLMLAAFGASSAGAIEHHEGGGHVKPCSLHGVNPAHHAEIFGDPDVAREHYGFVQKDGKWHVEEGCRRHGHHAELSEPRLLSELL